MVFYFGKIKTKLDKSILSHLQLKGSRENQVVQIHTLAVEGEK